MEDTNSSRSEIRRELCRSNISPNLKKNILFTTSVTCNVRDSYSSMKPKKKKRWLADRIQFRYVKKYRFLSSVKPYYMFDQRNRLRGSRGRRKEIEAVKHVVREYYLNDSVSSSSPNKNYVIVKKQIKKHKRFLQNSLKYFRLSSLIPHFANYAHFRW